MAKKKKYEYKLTRAGRKDVRQRAKSEAGMIAKPSRRRGVRSKVGQVLTGKKYKIPTVGSGTRQDKEREMVKPKKVGYRYREFEGQKSGETKEKERFDVEGKTREGYEEKIEGRYKSLGKRKPDTKEHKDWQGAKDLAENERLKKEGKLEYKKGSRTESQLVKDRDLKRRRKYLQDKYGEKRGRRKMYRERKAEYKQDYKERGYLGKK